MEHDAGAAGARIVHDGGHPEEVDAVLGGLVHGVGPGLDVGEEVVAGGVDEDVIDVGVEGADVGGAGTFVIEAAGDSFAEEAFARDGGIRA